MKYLIKKIILSSFARAVLSLICAYFAAFSSLYILNRSGVKTSELQVDAVMIIAYVLGSVVLYVTADSDRDKQHFRQKLLLIYITIIGIHCFWGAFIVPQSGGINLLCRVMSPIMGPWSRFLPPNALRLNRISWSFMIFSGVISVLVPMSTIIVCKVQKKVIQNIAMLISFTSIFIWSGYGFYRILLDIM